MLFAKPILEGPHNATKARLYRGQVLLGQDIALFA